ncbi:MAG: bifunctional YncE family protein/alkaline phosphatase family protein [Janthinobacterium lividum]
MNTRQLRLPSFCLTLGLSALLAGAGLSHPLHAAHTAKSVALPDLPDAKGTGTRLPNGWRITPAGTPIALPGDLPLKMLFSPDGKYLLVNTGGYHNHSVDVIDPATNKLVQSVDVDKNWAGLCFDPAGRTVYAAAGEGTTAYYVAEAVKNKQSARRVAALQETILRLGYADGRLTLQPALPVPSLAGKEHFTAGLASGRDGSLYMAEIEGDQVYKFKGDPAVLQASFKAHYHPYAAVLSPDGNTLAVSNMGGRSVSLLDAGDLKEVGQVAVGSHPNEMVWAKDGRLFVANAGSNSVSVIVNGAVRETIKTSLSPRDLVGSTPDALAVSPNGQRLYVANADNNDVALVDISDAKEARVLGFIPTGWYPSALAIAPNGRTLYVGTGKGLGFRGNPNTTTPYTETQGKTFDYIGGLLSGAVSAVRLPDAKGLGAYTRQVLANVPKPLTQTRHGAWPAMDALRKIKHVVYIIRENRTYDQVFGDIAKGNGDAGLTLFGQVVTPNAHALAAHYVLLDNLYCNGEVSEDGHQWCDAAYVTNFTEKVWPSGYSGRGEPDADDRVTDSPASYLWDNCARHGVTFHTYGEFSSFKASPNSPPVFTGSKGLIGHASAAWDAIAFGRHDTEHAAVFLADLHAAEKTGVWPQFMVMSLAEDHTQGLEAGKYTPSAHVASNDQALGQIVEGISRSRFWKDTAIFVIEDDAQNGPDHVDAHRTVGLLISPYVRRNAVDSTQYTTASMVRTMEMILGLPPMTQYDQNAMPMLGCFTSVPDLTAYADVKPQVDLEAKNPATGAGAVASAKLDLSGPDRADPDALNAILWHALKPGIKMPAPVRSARLLQH